MLEGVVAVDTDASGTDVGVLGIIFSCTTDLASVHNVNFTHLFLVWKTPLLRAAFMLGTSPLPSDWIVSHLLLT